jgi:DNA-binding XRE family transcriptional regulator
MKKPIITNLEHRRCLLGIHQKTLAQWLGMSQSSITIYETRKSKPSYRNALLLCEYLNKRTVRRFKLFELTPDNLVEACMNSEN